MAQDYPDYEISVMVDSEDDPARQVVAAAIKKVGFSRVRVTTLGKRLETCSLKCSALVQLVEELPTETEVVVLADADLRDDDLVSHAGWLRALVTPLVDRQIGVTHGNRWFWPSEPGWGSLVRYLWNAAAVVPMYVLGIPWGGTFAIRASTLRESGLLEKWSKAVVEDAPVRSALEEQGLKVQFVPELMMVNREECDLPFSLDFIKRQLTWTKIYHPNWWVVVGHAWGTSLLLLGAFLLLGGSCVSGQMEIAAWVGGGMTLYWAALLALLAMLERGMRQIVKARGESVFHFHWTTQCKLIVAIPLTQAVYLVAVLLATFRRRVAWRGVIYEVRGPWEIRMLNYHPFEQLSRPEGANRSL